MTRSIRLNPSVPIVVALMALTAVLRVINITGSPTRLDDEGTYVAQAFAVVQWGELAHYTYWYDHPPAGWLQLALWMVITGPGFGGNAVVAGRFLMVLVAVVTAGLLWLLARRVGLSRWAAAVAVTIVAVSPLATSLSRSVYLDNLAVAWVLGALVLICSPRQRLSAMFGAAICFGVAVLTKETMLLLVPMVAWLLWTKTVPATRRYALAVFGAVSFLVVSTYIVMAVIRGELLPGPGHVSLWEGIKFQLWQRESGGALGDPDSLKRHTIDEWLRLDPVLPLLTAPIALAGLLVERLRPYAAGLLILVVMVVRPGYLPVPFVIATLPLSAMLAAGLAQEVVGRLGNARGAKPAKLAGWRRTTSGLAAAFGVSMAVALWLPGHEQVLASDDDASLQQAQQWISQNVSKKDRLIVDDALWVDLVEEGRDRHNVVWSYKVDTDEQVQKLAPDGWADYDWVVSTPSMRANMPDQGVLTDAISHARPVATFGAGGKKVDVLRVDNGTPASSPAPPAAPSAGVQVAARLDAGSDPDAVATLQSRTVDQRVVAALAVITASQPVVLEGIASVSAERIAETPSREFTVAGPPERLRTAAAFFDRQESPFAVESVVLRDDRLTVRFPAKAGGIGLGSDAPPVPAGVGSIRVSDMRRDAAADRLEFVRIDGGPGGSMVLGDNANPTEYRSIAAGTYVMTTVDQRTGTVKMRQAFTVSPGASYTLGLFSAAESSEMAAQLAPDGPAGGPLPEPTVRLLHAGGVTGPVKLALTSGAGEPTVLADNASYGLITGYLPQPPGAHDAVITVEGREFRRPVVLDGAAPTTLILADGPDGPELRQVSDVPGATTPLDPPNMTIPEGEMPPDKAPSKPVDTNDQRQQVIPLTLCVAVIAGAVALAVRARRSRR
ncbi:ArnT family glycosyltransferase [Mycolicibacterium celeriflavum]|uniref:ArnT family glycosyltransferase n=1 Tax=Mycolicibacterium celeriflavum TaxID=1249101 RepID=UPI003CEE4AD7